MTKSETREVSKAISYTAAGLGPDYLARALSGLYRAARTTKSQNVEYVDAFRTAIDAAEADALCRALLN